VNYLNARPAVLIAWAADRIVHGKALTTKQRAALIADMSSDFERDVARVMLRRLGLGVKKTPRTDAEKAAAILIGWSTAPPRRRRK